MRVQTVSPAASKPTAALTRAVDGAMKDIKKVQSRMTEELRAEDAIQGLSIKGGKVVAEVDSRYEYKPAGLKQLVAELLKKHGVSNATVELHKAPDPEKSVHAAQAAIVKVQNRLTRDLRVEDGIAGLSFISGKNVVVALKANQPYDETKIANAVKAHLAAAGLKGARIEFVRPAINIRPVSSVVDEAMDAIKQVQSRLTADMRAEDDVVNLSVSGAGAGEVRVVLRARSHFSDADITKAVKKHLEKAGLPNADITFIRPRILPMRPPVVGGQAPVPMKAKVEAFAADIKKVQSRMTEEIRVEDAVKSIKVVGAKVVLTLNPQGPVSHDGITAWAKQELKDRGITLPLVVKV